MLCFVQLTSMTTDLPIGEIFSPIEKLTSIRVLLSLATPFYLEIVQMDVNITFLHGDLEEEIYMKQPEGFVVKGKKDLV
jgi:hypothetical protein